MENKLNNLLVEELKNDFYFELTLKLVGGLDDSTLTLLHCYKINDITSHEIYNLFEEATKNNKAVKNFRDIIIELNPHNKSQETDLLKVSLELPVITFITVESTFGIDPIKATKEKLFEKIYHQYENSLHRNVKMNINSQNIIIQLKDVEKESLKLFNLLLETKDYLDLERINDNMDNSGTRLLSNIEKTLFKLGNGK